MSDGLRRGTPEPRYWDEVALGTASTSHPTLWRLHSDQVNLALLRGWLPAGGGARMLKTDLFDEALTDGLVPFLAENARSVVGIDCSLATLRAARERNRRLPAAGADVRSLPFGDASFDVVVSNSTLDHFETLEELLRGLREILRVLRPDGRLLLTLDNLGNPLVRLRNALPFGLLHRLGLVPYYVGASCNRRRLARLLRQAGFEVLERGAIMHCPRVLAVTVARFVESRLKRGTQKGFLRRLMSFERLARWPTRDLTGHFVAVLAVRPGAAVDSRPPLPADAVALTLPPSDDRG